MITNRAPIEPPTICGADLCPDDREWALRHFVNRFTLEHKPDWAFTPTLLGREFLPQFRSDQEWLSRTRFFAAASGRIDRKCNLLALTDPTWPHGKYAAPSSLSSSTRNS